MGIHNQHKVHKKLELYDDRITELENMILSMCRLFFTMFITAFIVTALIDPIRARPFEFGWLQIVGMIFCVVIMFWSSELIVKIQEERRGW